MYIHILEKCTEGDLKNLFTQPTYYELRQLKLNLLDIQETKLQVLPQISSEKKDNLQEILMRELSDMEKAIQEAANKIGV